MAVFRDGRSEMEAPDNVLAESTMGVSRWSRMANQGCEEAHSASN